MNIKPKLGGIATPFGIYLTTLNLRAGASDFALFCTGVLITLIYILTIKLLEPIIIVLSNYTNLMVIDFLILFVFLALIKLSPLSAYHATEHKVINCIERNLNLDITNVSRMPSFHPRCGSNLLGLFILGQVLITLLMPLFLLDFSLLTIFFIFTLILGWRSIGKAIQLIFTTKEPSTEQIINGIKVGKEILYKYYNTPNYKANILKKIWNLGFLQLIAGSILTFIIVIEFIKL